MVLNKKTKQNSGNENVESSGSDDEDFDNHPLILSIKKELGGKEIK